MYGNKTCTIVHKNHINDLCEQYKKYGECYDLNCESFHPKINCKYGLKCRRKECSFKHPIEYYMKNRSLKTKPKNDILQQNIFLNLEKTLSRNGYYSLFGDNY